MEITSGLKAVLEYAQHVRLRLADGRGLILKGPVGTGKSAAAALLVMQCVDDKIPAWFADCTSLLSDLSAIHALGQANKFDALEHRLMRADVLVLDDVGQERGDSWAQEQLEKIIAQRYAKMRPTVITTNLTEAQMAGRYGERIIDRLRQTSESIVFKGKSFRGGVA